MKERGTDILDKALDALANATDIKIEVEHYLHKNPEYDATGNLVIDGNKIPLAIKLTVRPTPAMVMLTRLNQTHEQTLIVTDYVNPIMAERLKAKDIWFLDTAGNAYIKQSPLFIYIKGNKPVEKPATRTLSRAFQPTGLKVIYAFLCNPELVNAPYREIAQTAEVALGTVGWIITDLTQLGHIVNMGNRGRRLKGRRKLLERWITAYPEKLRPKLETGRYKAPNPDWWRTTPLHNLQAYWGGEVAADRLTHYLKPEIITIYAMEKWAGKLKITNKLRNDPDGDVEILKTFWDVENEKNKTDIVNPILIYADLMATGDPRNIETAEIIYEQKLAQHFREVSEPIVKIYELIAEIANKSNVRFFVIGATARDMVFEHGYDIPTSRATRDIDLAVQVATWAEFLNLKNALIATGYFAGSKTMQRMYYQNQIPIDIVPFGAIENEGSISWPPDDSVQMNVTGFNDAYRATQTVRLRESPVLDISVVTPAALVILKLMAWKDRSSEHSKDAIDLAFILRWYLDAGHTERLTEDHNDLLVGDVDFELTGARMLGRDVASIVSAQSKQMLDEVLNAETGEQEIYRLVEAMSSRQEGRLFENNLALLKALYLGLNETLNKNH